MPAWLASIVTSVFKAGMEYLKLWYDGEKAAETAWNAKTAEAKLESVKEAAKMELEIRDAPFEPTANPMEWNAKVSYSNDKARLNKLKRTDVLRLRKITAAGLLLVLLLAPGCALFTKYVYTPAKLPMIEAPARPDVPTEPVTWTSREKILADYAATLESRVQEYNVQALAHNIEHGYK